MFLRVLGRRLVFVGDEYYLLAERPFPPADAYEGFAMHEDGVGMARTFELELFGAKAEAHRHAGRLLLLGRRRGLGGRGLRALPRHPGHRRPAPARAPVAHGRRSAILTGTYGARVLAPLWPGSVDRRAGRAGRRTEFFGGTTGVTGLLVGEDLARTLAAEPEGHRYLLPDVCLSNGRFLDGTGPEDLPRPVEVDRHRRPRPARGAGPRRCERWRAPDDRRPPSPWSAGPTSASRRW